MTTPSVNPSGRVQVIPAPVASPGQCGICGKSSHPKGFVAPDLHFEFYGTLIFCADCVGDMASTLGYHSPEDLADLRNHVEDQDVELNTLRQAILGLESAVDGLTNYRDIRGNAVGRPNRPAVSTPVPDAKPEPPVTPADPPKPDRPAGGVTGVGESTEPQPDQPVSVAGPDDVYDTDTTLAELGLDLGTEP